ncbi:MAG: hypothetical protein RLZZ297_128 [Chloroflexota bacterium]|jgi:hypothetical protein
MDQDTRPREPRRATPDRNASDTSLSAPLRLRKRDQKPRVSRSSALAYLDKLLNNFTPTSQTAPIPVAGPIYERCLALVQALGDPDNPNHIQAAEELVTLGPNAVPVLIQALHPDNPWLLSYRAAEVLGEIGDRSATQPLIDALAHPNSNVRWSVVRSLSVVGNTRALLALRRVARDDRAKTTWGESIAGVAQSAIDQMQTVNITVKVVELLKTAISTIILLLALVLAWKVFERVRGEISTVGIEPTATAVIDTAPAAPQPENTDPTATVIATQTTIGDIPGVIINPGNVREQPAIQANNVVGQVVIDDEIFYLATTPDRTWFKIKLGAKRSATSSIGTADGAGWINEALVVPPEVELPIEDMQLPTRVPAKTATPEPEPTATTEGATGTEATPAATAEGGVAATEIPPLPPEETPTPQP